MKTLTVTSFLFCLLLAACNENRSANNSYGTVEDSIASQEFPILIEGGTKTVYRFGRMTPRGLKFFLDTVENRGDGILLPDSLKSTFLFPLSLSAEERESTPCIIAVSLPGFWEETIFGKIDTTGRLYMNYKDQEIQFSATQDVVLKPGEWSGVFRNDSIEVRISTVLRETEIGDHLAGKGNIMLWERNKLIEEQEIFFVYNKKQIIAR